MYIKDIESYLYGLFIPFLGDTILGILYMTRFTNEFYLSLSSDIRVDYLRSGDNSHL